MMASYHLYCVIIFFILKLVRIRKLLCLVTLSSKILLCEISPWIIPRPCNSCTVFSNCEVSLSNCCVCRLNVGCPLALISESNIRTGGEPLTVLGEVGQADWTKKEVLFLIALTLTCHLQGQGHSKSYRRKYVYCSCKMPLSFRINNTICEVNFFKACRCMPTFTNVKVEF